MARKKKTEEATAAVVDAAPVAEALETEQAAPVEAVEEADAEGLSPEEIRAVVRAERARLNELWRMGGCGELEGIGAELRDVLRGIKARPDVHRPASLGEQVLTTAELIKVLEEVGGDWAPVLRRWYRANHRRAGTSIYVQLREHELDEEGVDEPGQEQGEGSAGV